MWRIMQHNTWHKVALTGMVAALFFIILGAAPVHAACSTVPTPGDDVLTCSGLSAGFDAGAGDDIITNNGTVGGIFAGEGNDTVTNNGTVNGQINGGPGNDTLINNGTVSSTDGLDGGPGTNTIYHNGRAAYILAGGSGSSVVIGARAVGMGGITGAANSTLCFTDATATDLAGKAPGGGTITLHGQTFTWSGFTALSTHCASTPTTPDAGTLNAADFASAPVAVSCHPEGLRVTGRDPVTDMTGDSFVVSGDTIRDALDSARISGENLAIRSTDGITLYALKSSELQVNAFNGVAGPIYEFIFSGTACEGVFAMQSTTQPTTSYPVNRPHATATTTPTGDGLYHTVQRGENLFRIGLRYGVHYTHLGEVNDIAPPYTIHVGEQIYIPASGN